MKLAGFFPLFFIAFILITCNTRDLNLFMPSTYFPKEKQGEPDTDLINNTPENVLENLKKAYNKRKYDLYIDLITKDYRFYMSDNYIGALKPNGPLDPPDPAYWTYDPDTTVTPPDPRYYKDSLQEVTAIRKMFDPAGKAKDIELFFHASPYILDPGKPDTVVYNVSNIVLTITLRDEQEPIMVAEDNNRLGPTEVTLVRGVDSLWRISKWIDNTAGNEDIE